MATFEYQANIDGRLVKGQVAAQSIAVAKIKLKVKNIDPVYIRKKDVMVYFSGGGKLKTKDILFMTRQMSFLLSSGLSLIQSLNMSIKLTESQILKLTLVRVLKQIESGKSFSGALSAYPEIFDGFFINMIAAAEETGLLDQALKDLTQYLEKSEANRAKIKSALTYPVMVIAISSVIITGIILFVVPKFEAIYSSTGGDLPGLTQLFVNLNHLMLEKWYVLIAIIVGVPLCLWKLSKTESGSKILSNLIHLIPIFSKLQYHAALARYCRSFGSLLKSGITFLEALDISANIAAREDIVRGLKFAKNYVSRGRSFKQGLEDSGAFPPLVINMTAIGEESGNLHENYEKLTEFYEAEIDNLVSAIIKMIEPLLIVFLGGAIGLIILALYLPVFNLGSVVG